MLSSIDDNIVPHKLAHRRTPTANDFPAPYSKDYGKDFTVNKRDQGLVSPTASSFSFIEDELQPHAVSTTGSIMEEKGVVRDLSRGTPGEGSRAPSINGESPIKELNKKKSQYYDTSFASREPALSCRERVYRDSPILAEVKTNVIVRDEFLLLSDLSAHLSQRYSRPASSIFVTLDHSACLLFAGSFDSAYILTITALPSQLLPTTNKRNAAMMQSFMSSSLGVLPDRGIIKFAGIPDECLAISGTTITGAVERLQKQTSGDFRPLPPSKEPPPMTKEMAPRNEIKNVPKRNASLKPRNHKPTPLSLLPKSRSTPGSKMPSPTFAMNGGPALPALPKEHSPVDKRVEKVQRIGKRKSFFGIFGRSL